MKKGIFCFIICLLMVLTAVVPISATTCSNEISYHQIKTDIQYREAEKIFNELQVKLDKVTTKQEALVLIKDVLVELHNHGLLPKAMSVRQAQRLITLLFLKNILVQSSQKSNGNDTGNSNCLVIGFAANTFFRPYPVILMDIPLIEYLVFNGTLSPYLDWLFSFYILRILSPLKLGPYAYVGERYKNFINGYLTDDISPATGLVWTLGMNGIKKWNGSFYGSLSTKYEKIVDGNNSYESWKPVGIRGFGGISFSNFISFAADRIPLFFIGFAREVNFTYNPPWT
jgi:hypothetical protein